MLHGSRLFVLTLVFAARPVWAADWPTWQHDNRRTGATEEQLQTKTLALKWTWQASSPPQTAWAGPAKYDAYAFHRNLPSMRNYDPVFHLISVGDQVWFGSSVDDSLYCLNAADGSEQWVVTTNAPVRLAPTWSEGRVYFGADDGYARCVRATDGQLIWKFSPSETKQLVLNNGRFIPPQPCRTGVVVERGTAWFACAMLPWQNSYLCAIDSKTGSTMTQQHYVKTLPGRTMEGAPALSSDALILPQGRVAPRVFDRKTGEDRGDMVKSGGGSVVVISLDETVIHGPATDSRKGGFRKSSGQSREMVAGLGRGNAMVVHGADSWMLTDDAIIASSLTEQNVHWKTPCDCPFSMIKAGNVLYVGGDRKVAAYSAKTGELLWQTSARGRIFGLVVANGRLFASSDTGTIHCYAAGAFTTPKQVSTHTKANAGDEGPVDIKPSDDGRLLGHWAFQETSTAGTRIKALRGTDLILSETARYSRIGSYQALELDGTKQTAMVSPDFKRVPVPETSFTAEAWVRVDQQHDWGGIIGIVQDDGDQEYGWLLGYRKKRFSVAVRSKNGPDELTYVKADSEFELGQWYHVVGSYDGAKLKLYVDGQLRGESADPSGAIIYPNRAWFEVGAYHDKDEYFRMKGALHEVRLYNAALAASDVSLQFESAKTRFPAHVNTPQLASGPWLQFDDPETATVRWTTSDPQPTCLDYGTSTFDRTAGDAELRTEHSAALTHLGRNRVYQYRISVMADGEERHTQSFECDNFFNYSSASAARIRNVPSHEVKNAIRRLSDESPARRGLCLVMGALEVEALVELCRISELRFVVAETDSEKVDQLRQALRQQGVYGNQMSVHHVEKYSQLPFPSCWANFVIVANAMTPDVIQEAQRSTRPNGGVTLLMHPVKGTVLPEFSTIRVNEQTAWHRWERPSLTDSSDWSHLYGAADNSAFAGERLGGARSTDDLRVQWIGRPGPRYQADRSGRKPSPLSTDGRLFLQGLHRIVAVDAFNGSMLWSLEIPELERFNMPRDCSNWCANDEFLFVAVKHECWKIAVESGEVVERISAVDSESGVPMEWGYVATHGDRMFGSAVRPGASWTSFWGGDDAGWYDARAGSVTFPVCSDRLFCRDANSFELTWEYQRGVVLNSTITVTADTMYFVESRSSKVMAAPERRIGDVELWKDLYLVAIDAATGSPKWEKKLNPMSRQVVMYLAHAADQLTLVSSADAAYRVTSFSDHGGSERWTQATKWPKGKGDHGKAMMRPAIVGDRIFLRPDVLSVKDGAVLPEKMPDGHGCGTYACTADAVFYRAGTVTMWNAESDTKSNWPRLRPDCWLSTIPANGMLLSPEGGGGCSCGSWMETSIGFIPKVFDRTPQ